MSDRVSAAESAPAASSLLRDRDYRRYLAARSLSGFGDLVTYVALPVLVYRLTDSATLTATVAGLEAVPYIVFGLLAGALADRWNRKTVMLAADLVDAGLLASIPIAHWLGVLTVPHLLAVAFLGPAVATFFDGAVFGAIPTLVGRHRIAQANSYVVGVQSMEQVALPSLVGVALAVIHPAAMLAVDAASFLASATLIRGIARPMHDLTRSRVRLSRRRLTGDIAEGVRFLTRHAAVRTMTIISFTQCVSAGGFVALMVVWADRQLGVGTSGWRFGVVFGTWAVGELLASVALPRLLRRTTPAAITLVALPVSAPLGMLTALWHTWWMGAAFLTAWGTAYTLVSINAVAYRQQVTPEPLLGRVNTAGRMLAWGMGWTGGAFLAGLLSRWLGLQGTLLAVTAVGLVGVVVAWTSPLVSEARSQPPAELAQRSQA